MLMFLPGDWRVLAIRGVAAIVFGVLTLVWPGLTLWALVVLFGAYALVDGVFTFIHAFTNELSTTGQRALLLLEGVCGVAAGVIAFAWPEITALALLYLIAAWAIVTGVIEIASAVALRGVVRNGWWLGLGGLASIVFGVLLMITPGPGALVITWLIGWYAVVFGITLLMLAFRVRRAESVVHGQGPAPGSFRHAAA
jgi:uncharacterized membrane protein HdeD (DUF308 family)